MFGIEDKLQIKQNLTELKDSVGNSPYIAEVCERYLNQIEEGKSFLIAENLVSDLTRFTFNPSVEKFVTDTKEKLNESVFANKIAHTVVGLSQSYDAKFYKGAIERLKKMMNLDENQIKNELKYGVNDLTWIPQISHIVSEAKTVDNELTDQASATINKVYSPIHTVEEGTVFHLSGKNYIDSTDGVFEYVNETPKAFNLLANGLRSFKITESGMKFFYGDTFEIKENESNEVRLFINDNEINSTGYELTETLLFTGKVAYDEIHVAEMITAMVEGYNDIAELDFVQNIKSNIYEGVELNLIKRNNRVYLNTINRDNFEVTFEEVSNINFTVENIKNTYDYDITNFVTEFLNKAQQEEIELSKQQETFEKRIIFLKEKIGELKDSGLNGDSIKQAQDMLEAEVAKFTQDLTDINVKLKVLEKKTEDDGYVSGTLRVRLDQNPVGTKIRVNALDYTQAGSNDMVRISIEGGGSSKVKKKDIKVDL